MSLIEAIIMGIIQGLTEFLPVSSSGHLAIASHILGIGTEENILFEVMLHLGTLVAIFVAFSNEIGRLILSGLNIIKKSFLWVKNYFKKDTENIVVIDTADERFVMLIIVSTIPTVIIGLSLKAIILVAFRSLIFPAIGLIITATILLITTKVKVGSEDESTLSYKKATVVGIAQGLAIFPGISRSGSTIVTGLFLGMKKDFIVKYSFIMSIPAILGAAILQLLEFQSNEAISNVIITYGMGMLASAIVGYLCIKLLLDMVRKGKLHYFAYYCYGLGILLLVYIIRG